MRWLHIRCDWCDAATTVRFGDAVMDGDGWATRVDGRDACPSCVWAIDCGEEPGPAPHPTVRPLPPAHRQSGEAA
jgi:hypothetical protein